MPGANPKATSSAGTGSQGAAPVRVEYVPKSQRRSGAEMPVRKPPPKVEEVSEVVAAEFADFDDGPAKVIDIVEPEILDIPDSAPPKVNDNNSNNTNNNRKSRRRRGSR